MFQLYHGENKLIFNATVMTSALYLTNTLSLIFKFPIRRKEFNVQSCVTNSKQRCSLQLVIMILPI